jgi:glycosyltransferase involved in cell wall biosynthesis
MALSGLDVADGRELLVRADDEAIAQATLRLLRDQNLRRTLGDAARQYVVNHHSWKYWASRMEQFYRSTIDLNRARQTGTNPENARSTPQ